MGAGRPVKKRTVKSYARDVEALNRLRMALKLDWESPEDLKAIAVHSLDELTDTLSKLAHLSEERRKKVA